MEKATVSRKKTRTETVKVNRRKHQRFECDGFAEVIISEASLMFRGRIRNLSPTGCFIETRARLSLMIGMAAELCFTVNDRSFRAVAEVKGIRQDIGVGFEIHLLVAERDASNDLLLLIQKLETQGTVPKLEKA